MRLVTLYVNGLKRQVAVKDGDMLLEVLRDMGYKSVKRGCDTAGCGICHVLVDDTLIPSCAYPVMKAEGRHVTTIEGVQDEARSIAEHLVAEGVEQCGYCSPGLVMSVIGMIRGWKTEIESGGTPHITLEEMKRHLAGSMCRCSGYEGQHRALMGYLMSCEPTLVPYCEFDGKPIEIAPKKGFKSVKHSIPKVDGMGLVLGKPAYTDDFTPVGSLVVKILRSPHAHAIIKSIDTSKALSMEGIECILTYEDVPDVTFSRAGQGYPEPSPYDAKVLDHVVRYVGDAVAIVAGANEEIVLEAMESIVVDYELKEAVLDMETALDHPVIIHDGDGTSTMFPMGHEPKRNRAAAYAMEIGDVAKTLETCDVIHKSRYHTQPQCHGMSEPHATVTYFDEKERLVVISSTQTPFHVRRILAKNLGLPLSRIRVIKPRIGGGYGGKQALHGEFYASLVTQRTKKPARLVYTRKEVFESTYTRHEMRLDVTLGATKDGVLKAIDMDVLSNTGAYGEHALTVLMVVGSKTLPLYNKVESVAFRGDVVYTNRTPAGAFRGYGAVQGNFALESAMDELADELGMDPVELRRINMIAEGQTSKIFEKMGEGTEGTPMVIESCKLDECLTKALEGIGWKEKYPRVVVDENRVRGVGFAIAMQGSGIPYIDMGAAILKLNDDGFFNLLVGATDLGTGSDTILAQIAAEVLGVPVERIIVHSSDTDLTPFDTGAYASSTTYVSGHGVRIAAERMKADIERKALEVYGGTLADFDGEWILVWNDADKRMDLLERVKFIEFATQLYYSKEQEQLVTTGSYVGTKSPPPYMVGACEVEVDNRTGEVRVLDFRAVVDCGTTINPNLARIQVEGAILQGIGMALYENVHVNAHGKMYENSFLHYRMPTRYEVGRIQVDFVESHEPSGPFGAKSVGEIGIDTPPAAIANAIKNALGSRMERLPMTPESIWKKQKTL